MRFTTYEVSDVSLFQLKKAHRTATEALQALTELLETAVNMDQHLTDKFKIVDDRSTQGYVILESDEAFTPLDVKTLNDAGYTLIYTERTSPARILVKKIQR